MATCTVVKLAVTDLSAAAKDPALAALLREGWSVSASVVMAPANGGEVMLQLLLSPPRPADALASAGGASPWVMPALM